jgi:hypothetical protein
VFVVVLAFIWIRVVGSSTFARFLHARHG